jgi:hypothetical protein
MAENESLDLKSPHAKRWYAVLDAARRGKPSQEVGTITRETLRKAVRKALTQFEKYGVTTVDFLDNRGSLQTLRRLIRQTKGHPYAELLVDVLDSNPAATRTGCLNQWLHGILDRVFDQLSLRLGGSGTFPSFYNTGSFFREVRSEVRGDLERIAINLIDNPYWKPSVGGKKGEPKTDVTVELLSMSLVGGAKP